MDPTRLRDGWICGSYQTDGSDDGAELLIGFYVWAVEAAALIEDANRTKQEYLGENPERELLDVFWESFPDG